MCWRGVTTLSETRVRVVTDTVSDVSDSLAEELGITMVPVVIKFGEEEVRDRVEITMPEFLARLAVYARQKAFKIGRASCRERV